MAALIVTTATVFPLEVTGYGATATNNPNLDAQDFLCTFQQRHLEIVIQQDMSYHLILPDTLDRPAL